MESFTHELINRRLMDAKEKFDWYVNKEDTDMRKVFTTIKGEAGRYYLHYKGVCYAHVYKTGNNSWFYEDSDRAYWFKHSYRS